MRRRISPRWPIGRRRVRCSLSHEQLAVVLAGIADGITALNPAGKLVYCNDIAARLIGYPSAQALLAVPNTEILSKFEIVR